MIKTTINKDAITIYYFFQFDFPSGFLSKLSEFSNAYVCNFNSFLVNNNFCGLLITYANRLEPDQDRQNVGPDLDPNCLTL